MNELRHIGLQVSQSDVENFYVQVLGGIIENSFVLSPEDGSLIFGIEKQMPVYWLNCNGFIMELFVNEEVTIPNCHHTCFFTPQAMAIHTRAAKKGYSVYIRKKYEQDTYFIKDNQRNLFEIKSA